MNSALSAVRVVELCEFDAGAACAEALAWFGADVVKVETSAAANARYATTEKPGIDSYDFILLNANKRSVRCDLESGRGKEQLSKLIVNADIVVEHLAPGAVERLGFGYDAVRQLNPRIIYAQLVGFASDGPRAHYPGIDMVAQATGGAISGTGAAGGPPLTPGPAIGDTGAALHAVMGILAALYQRAMTGQGQRIQVDMQTAVINLCRITYLMRGKPLERIGNASRAKAVPSNLFACKPGGPNDYVLIHISKSANKHWQALLKVLGREDLMKDPRYTNNQTRLEYREEIEAMVAAWCREHTKIEAMEAIQNAGAPAGAVLDAHDLSADEHLRKHGMFATVNHPTRGAITMPGWPVQLSASRVQLRSAPLLGAHTEEVLSEWLAPRQPKQPETHKETQQLSQNAGPQPALAGVRIVDLTQFEAGTSCTEALAWLGADVVKIEEPGSGDRGRSANTDQPGVDAHYFVLLNANKRSLTCDLKSKRGKEILRKLIAQADVLVENMAPGAIERLGFGYDAMRQLNPRLIFAQIKGLASDGPRANYLCFDMIAQSIGGSLSTTGVAGEEPLKPGANLGDTGAGMHCVTGIVAALCQRQKTGRGQRVEVAMQEVVINFNRNAFASYLASGKPPERSGSRSIYACKGGGPNDYCYIPVLDADDGQWQRALRAIGREDLAGDPRFATEHERHKHSDEVDTLLSAWCVERTKVEAMDTLQAAHVPAGAVLDTEDLISDSHLRKIGMFPTVIHPVRGPVTLPGWPVRMSGSHVPVECAPLLGAHTGEVLSEWLGFSKEQIDEFRNTAAVAGQA